jgi:hypothetical protein
MSKQEEIKDYVGKFVEGLTKKIRDAVHETVDAAFADGGDAPEAEPAPAPRARKTQKAPRAPAKQAAPDATSADSKQVLSVIKANPGCNGGLIKRQTGLEQWRLGRALKDLASMGTIKKSGNGRGTTYSTR